MLLKMYFGKEGNDGYVQAYTDEIVAIDCPNTVGGIGDIEFKGAGVWTGRAWITGNFKIHFGSFHHIETRSDDSESDEKWKKLWTSKKKFCYCDYYTIAFKLKEFLRIEGIKQWAKTVQR